MSFLTPSLNTLCSFVFELCCGQTDRRIRTMPVSVGNYKNGTAVIAQWALHTQYIYVFSLRSSPQILSVIISKSLAVRISRRCPDDCSSVLLEAAICYVAAMSSSSVTHSQLVVSAHWSHVINNSRAMLTSSWPSPSRAPRLPIRSAAAAAAAISYVIAAT